MTEYLEPEAAELHAYRKLFGGLVAEHEWWQPGVRMGDPDVHVRLPTGHDHLDESMQQESRSSCRRCAFESLVAMHTRPPIPEIVEDVGVTSGMLNNWPIPKGTRSIKIVREKVAADDEPEACPQHYYSWQDPNCGYTHADS